MANISIDTSAELNIETEAFTENTRARYDVFNEKYKQFLENDNYLNTQVEEIKSVNSSQAESIASLVSKDSSLDSDISALQQRAEALESDDGLYLTATISKNGWSGTSVPYSNTVSGLSGITENSHPTIALNIPIGTSAANYKSIVKAFGMIGSGVSVNNGIVFYSFNKNPASVDIDIPISIREH